MASIPTVCRFNSDGEMVVLNEHDIEQQAIWAKCGYEFDEKPVAKPKPKPEPEEIEDVEDEPKPKRGRPSKKA